MKRNYFEKSVAPHRRRKGKRSMTSNTPIASRKDAAAAIALSEWVENPNYEYLLPNALDKSVPKRTAIVVEETWKKQF